MPLELLDPDAAARFLLAGLAARRISGSASDDSRAALTWSLELLAEGEAMPPAGVLADLHHLAFDSHTALHPNPGGVAIVLPSALVRRYEDDVLGKALADRSFDRAAAALGRHTGRDRARGLALVWTRISQRSGFEGAIINPAVVRALLSRRPDELERTTVPREEARRLLVPMYESLCTAFRGVGDLLGPEDLFELERGTALAAFGQRLALRQTLQAAALLEAGLPAQPPQLAARAREVSAPIPDEDVYPVGGFASISTRGSIESLLHSQLAYMEPDERPDLFDVKYVRDELLYYSRDDNLFLHPRRTIVFTFDSDLAAARVKDAGLPWQRIILVCGLVVAVIRRLTQWLSHESLTFELAFDTTAAEAPLANERELLSLILREELALGRVRVETRTPAGNADSSTGRVASVWISAAGRPPRSTMRLVVGEQPRVVLRDSDTFDARPEARDAANAEPLAAWKSAAEHVCVALCRE